MCRDDVHTSILERVSLSLTLQCRNQFEDEKHQIENLFSDIYCINKVSKYVTYWTTSIRIIDRNGQCKFK